MRVKDLAQLARNFAMPALAITDTGNLFGALEFSEAMSDQGVQPIIGCSLKVDFTDATGESRFPAPGSIPTLALLAKDEQGYANLMRLSSMAYLESPESAVPHVRIASLGELASGLICLTGGHMGPLNEALADGQTAACAPACSAAASDLWRSPVRRVAASQPGLGGSRRARPRRTGL